MTLHPRLQQPTLESPVRRGHGFTMALALTVLAAGFAYAMPRTVLTNAEDPQQAELVLSPTGSTHTSTATTPRPKKTKDGAEEDSAEHDENHGAAVSTAAHCDLDGRAHGEFVRSIAHDKDATVAEVEAACAAAQAADATAADADDVTHGRGHARSPKPKLNGAPEGDSDDDAADVAGDDASAESAADNDDAGNGGPPEHAKGPKDKP
jgi:hypothetical protein